MPEESRPFKTKRTKYFRQTELNTFDESLIGDIEGVGCSIIQIPKTNCAKGWAFTVGVYDTCGYPEIISVGLLDETAHILLNSAATAARNGIDLTKGRHREMIGEVECEFRPVDSKWIKQLMGYACWYYGGPDFPVLQAVYPDRENRFPEDESFEPYFRQPLLQPGAEMSVVEEDFWAAADPDSSLANWKFADPPHTLTYLSQAVHTGAEQITYVSHDMDDGAWQFLGDSMSGDQEPAISCLHHPIDKDPSLNELVDLPLGWCATRTKPGEAWMRQQKESEVEEEEG